MPMLGWLPSGRGMIYAHCDEGGLESLHTFLFLHEQDSSS